MTKQIIFGNIEDNGSKGTVEKYHNEKIVFETTPHLTISNEVTYSNVTLDGSFIAKSFHARSDQRLKENIDVLQNSLSLVKKMDGKQYNFKDNKNKTSYGFIAQEIEQVLPDLVQSDVNGIKSISYGEIIPILTNAIKELNAKIEKLENNHPDRTAICNLTTKIESIIA